MVHNPKISVCVPTYNGEEYLRECLESFRAQTFTDFEVLVFDDNSSDGTRGLAAEFARQDSRFRVQKNPQRLGLVGNWNVCARAVRGEWIKYVFQDDLLRVDCLEKMLAMALAKNASFICCRRDFIFEGDISADVRDFYQGTARQIDEFFAKENPASPENFARQ